MSIEVRIHQHHPEKLTKYLDDLYEWLESWVITVFIFVGGMICVVIGGIGALLASG